MAGNFPAVKIRPRYQKYQPRINYIFLTNKINNKEFKAKTRSRGKGKIITRGRSRNGLE